MILRLGSRPRSHVGKTIEANSDFRFRGGRLMISLLVSPVAHLVSAAARA